MGGDDSDSETVGGDDSHSETATAEQHEAASKIQAAQRGKMGRKRARGKKQQKVRTRAPQYARVTVGSIYSL